MLREYSSRMVKTSTACTFWKVSTISVTSLANDRGAFWEERVRDSWNSYPSKEAWMTHIRLWFEEPDIGLADIAWDLISLERGEDSL